MDLKRRGEHQDRVPDAMREELRVLGLMALEIAEALGGCGARTAGAHRSLGVAERHSPQPALQQGRWFASQG